MAILIDGKELAGIKREEIAKETKELADKTGTTPGLAVVIVGDDPASQTYVRNKAKACEEVGFYSEVVSLPANTSQRDLLKVIAELNDRIDIDGILVQLPLPKHINEKAVIGKISPKKDVDGFTPSNAGKVLIGSPKFAPCTPAGIMELVKSTGINIEGKHCVVVGRSNIVGKPVAMMMLHENATVTICHSKTANLKEITSKADILIAAVGKPGFITGDMVKEGAVVIDVGINRNEEGKLCGDVNFEQVEPKAGFITPVPGGVGPMTITMLLKNTLDAALYFTEEREKIRKKKN
ncbi:MAG: bifunctional methylenetetrahydrofolate dehydrogenase/methenyltetrahydrofolate cyclohydrolase FolD [Clostridia bacterium]|nr:bifunctional methylenetetrahydrofolate dehydrogenase/methenyltetrahydrofolate cyclohydrolase FolD [Clostridia bacterium]MBQ2152854.1 bifunctional methylenetetrahydrofolate dehydrogenase/methenyltetrahydrofolate cyclohydrolase FolD [Clostridia bacterium]MBQ2347750.1 bifunctional methylenetetrahydrofolate dehydrogenase/methenyltetrahydrofolate cyclohydrolase FolD [Clostridia bacterium]MBQ5439786.1 bifunctional methylenetetrahydrofolate dehydrogenase/methenyltetrahydrofolate cyclohydrolase FolD 